MAWGHLPFDCGDLNRLLGSHLTAASSFRVSKTSKTPTIILNHHLTTTKKNTYEAASASLMQQPGLGTRAAGTAHTDPGPTLRPPRTCPPAAPPSPRATNNSLKPTSASRFTHKMQFSPAAGPEPNYFLFFYFIFF